MLVGDYLFARSFQLMADTGNMQVMQILANASATIAEGEVLQLTAAQDIATSEDTISRSCAARRRRCFPPRPSRQRRRRRRPGGSGHYSITAMRWGSPSRSWMTCWITAARPRPSENVGDDFRERKLTLPVIKAIAAADADERAFWERCIGQGQAEGDLDQALAILAGAWALDAARADAIVLAERAKSGADCRPAHPLRDELADLAGLRRLAHFLTGAGEWRKPARRPGFFAFSQGV